MIFHSRLYKAMASREGFTVIEVLVSLSIFTVAVLGLAVGAITIVRANKTSQFHTVATNLAQDKLEQLKAATVANITPCGGDGCENPQPQYQNIAFTRTWAVTNNSPVIGATQIDVTVQWTDYTAHALTVSSSVPQ
jgi:Tfp pilus assembly protein PilV